MNILPKPGWRVIKTALSVFICILLYHFIFHRQNPMIACLSAIFSMREDVSASFHFGQTRMMSNAIGGAYALLMVLLCYYPSYHVYKEIILIPLAVLLFILTMLRLNRKAGIINGSAALLMIYFTTAMQHPLWSALLRFLDTVVGASVAIGINALIHPHHPLKETPEQKAQRLRVQIQHAQEELQQIEKEIQS